LVPSSQVVLHSLALTQVLDVETQYILFKKLLTRFLILVALQIYAQ